MNLRVGFEYSFQCLPFQPNQAVSLPSRDTLLLSLEFPEPNHELHSPVVVLPKRRLFESFQYFIGLYAHHISTLQPYADQYTIYPNVVNLADLLKIKYVQ